MEVLGNCHEPRKHIKEGEISNFEEIKSNKCEIYNEIKQIEKGHVEKKEVDEIINKEKLENEMELEIKTGKESSQTNKINVVQNILTKSPENRSISEILSDILVWPDPNISKNKRKREHLPSALTSEKWVEITQVKEQKKKLKEEEKNERKCKRERNKANKVIPKNKRREKCEDEK